jgi:hypothetical protein
MKITDGAKSIIMEALASNECDCLQVTQQQSCCGTSLNFALIKLQADEIPVSINGVSVMMDNQTQVRAETVTLGAEKGELTLHDATQSCC